MSADRDIDALLAELGFSAPAARERGRAALQEAKLTRAGKQRISEEKLPRVREALAARFFVHCSSTACIAAAKASGREPVPTDLKSACEKCGGSDNRRAGADLVAACRRHGVMRLVVVGGSPSVREELASVIGGALELRLVDGTERRTGDKARGDLAWADLVLIWGASELHHKVSLLYTQAPPPLRSKVILSAKRGVAALLQAAIEHLEGTRRT